MVRKNAQWTEISHERILEHLQDYGPSSPSMLAEADGIERLGVDEEDILERCRRLEQEGLVINAGGENFVITDLGESYLDGDHDLTEDGLRKSHRHVLIPENTSTADNPV